MQLQNRLEQKRVARECAAWMKANVQIRSVKQVNLLHGKMYHIDHDGVEDNKIRTHKGCIIANSVGLGKTFEALAIVKYFGLLNDRVLVLCPKKLRENWTIYQAQNNSELNPFIKDRFSYTVLSHTDLSRDSGFSGDINLETINWGNYDLVVIDESHNFRNNTSSRRDEEGNIIRKGRYERLMEDILKTGIKTKVLLLSATPVNNDLKDLRNQFYFLTEGRDDRVVRFTFAQPKQILEIYRLLCAERTTPYEQLCNLFDQQTCHGNDMTVYSELLQAAITSIVSTFRKRALSNLQSSRSAVLMEVQSQVEQTTDSELITWLVIQNEA